MKKILVLTTLLTFIFVNTALASLELGPDSVIKCDIAEHQNIFVSYNNGTLFFSGEKSEDKAKLPIYSFPSEKNSAFLFDLYVSQEINEDNVSLSFYKDNRFQTHADSKLTEIQLSEFYESPITKQVRVSLKDGKGITLNITCQVVELKEAFLEKARGSF